MDDVTQRIMRTLRLAEQYEEAFRQKQWDGRHRGDIEPTNWLSFAHILGHH
ncbi:hypothetical protein TorRG33x02_283260, partial [Trema orientale]